MPKVSFDGITKIISITQAPVNNLIEIDVQVDLYSDWKEWVLQSDNAKYAPALRSVGGDPISQTRSLGATYFLINEWKIRPFNTDHRLLLVGNLYTDPAGASPILSTLDPHSVIVEYSISSLVDSSVSRLDTDNLKYQIEALRSTHQGFGNVFFVEPDIGNDLQAGTSPTTPVATIAKALQLCVSGRGDVIYLLASSEGVVEFNESLVIEKEDIHIRGPGRLAHIHPISGPAITVNADNFSIIGSIIHAPTGSTTTDCIVINKNFTRLQNLYLYGTNIGTGCGIKIRGGGHHDIKEIEIEQCGGNGICIHDDGLPDGAPETVRIENCKIYDCLDNGIDIQGDPGDPLGTSTRIICVQSTHLTDNTGWGININEYAYKVNLTADNIYGRNGLGDINNLNPTNIIVQSDAATLERIERKVEDTQVLVLTT